MESRHSSLLAVPALLGLGALAYRLNPVPPAAPKDEALFIQRPAPSSSSRGLRSLANRENAYDPGPALDRMLLAVPQELEGKTAANAPGGALAATNAGAAGAAGAAPRRSTATTELAAQPRLPLTAFPQNNRPRVEAQTPVQPPPMLDQAPEPQRPPQPHLHAAPFRAMGGGGGGGGGMRGMGRPRGRR